MPKICRIYIYVISNRYSMLSCAGNICAHASDHVQVRISSRQCYLRYTDFRAAT